MSMYLIIEDKNCVWFGGDSALSHIVDDKTFRDPCTQVEKVFCHAGGVFACGGSLWDALQIRRYIDSLPTVNEESLSDISKALGQISAYSRTHGYSEESVTTVLMCCLLDMGRVYGMSPNNNFVVESPVDPKLNGFRTVACIGVTNCDSSKGNMLATKYYPESANIPELFGKVYSDLSCNGMGGHVDLYCLNVSEKSIQRYYVPLVEENIEYVNASATMQGGYINWGVVNSDPVATGASSTASTALSRAKAAADNIKQLADGSYSGGTFIDGQNIVAPYIRGGEIRGVQIYGGAFYDSKGNAKLVLNPSKSNGKYADLILYNGADTSMENPAFSIYDNVGSITLGAYGVDFLTAGAIGSGHTYAQGKWVFVEPPEGIEATFA